MCIIGLTEEVISRLEVISLDRVPYEYDNTIRGSKLPQHFHCHAMPRVRVSSILFRYFLKGKEIRTWNVLVSSIEETSVRCIDDFFQLPIDIKKYSGSIRIPPSLQVIIYNRPSTPPFLLQICTLQFDFRLLSILYSS